MRAHARTSLYKPLMRGKEKQNMPALFFLQPHVRTTAFASLDAGSNGPEAKPLTVETENAFAHDTEKERDLRD